MHRLIFTLLVSALVSALLSATPIVGSGYLLAQEPIRIGENRQPNRVPVTVALVERLPEGSTRFAILRRPDVEPNDVILLPVNADAAQFSEAVRTLLLARRTGGDHVASNAILRIRPAPAGSNRGRAVLPWAERVLRDLRNAAPRDIPGLGQVSSVQIWLPPLRPGTRT